MKVKHPQGLLRRKEGGEDRVGPIFSRRPIPHNTEKNKYLKLMRQSDFFGFGLPIPDVFYEGFSYEDIGVYAA